jgi:hypothetical protein
MVYCEKALKTKNSPLAPGVDPFQNENELLNYLSLAKKRTYVRSNAKNLKKNIKRIRSF